MKTSLAESNILVTGGTGSFGSALIKKLLSLLPQVEKIICYSRRWQEQKQLESEINGDSRVRFFIGDIRDTDRLNLALRDVNIVFHCAAIKDVPSLEYSPNEGILTNCNGTWNVIRAALDRGVDKVLFISSDKAVSPVNLYGASKAIGERLIVSSNHYSGGSSPIFSAARWGNVVGSSGSVVPLFRKQAQEGKAFTITDERMTRFWIAMSTAVDFALQSVEWMEGGEIFVPHLKASRIVDVALALRSDIPVQVVGIRPGEKLHETLISDEELQHTYDLGWGMLIAPEVHLWNRARATPKSKIPYYKTYSSNSVEHYSINELRQLLK